jgi:Ca2+-transporting ATPase
VPGGHGARGLLAAGCQRRLSPGCNAALPAAVAAALALQLAGLYLPFLRELLHTRPLTGIDLLVVFLASTLGYAAVRLDRVSSAAGSIRRTRLT